MVIGVGYKYKAVKGGECVLRPVEGPLDDSLNPEGTVKQHDAPVLGVTAGPHPTRSGADGMGMTHPVNQYTRLAGPAIDA